MKRTFTGIAILTAASLAAYGQQETLPENQAGQPAQEQALESDVQADASMKLIQSSQIEGSAVRNAQDEEIGTVEQLLFDSQTGKIHFAIVSAGGFLGLGERHVPIPWKALQMAQAEEGEHVYFTVDTNKEQLEKAPEFHADQPAEFESPEKLNSVYTYWGLEQEMESSQPELQPESELKSETETELSPESETEVQPERETLNPES